MNRILEVASGQLLDHFVCLALFPIRQAKLIVDELYQKLDKLNQMLG